MKNSNLMDWIWPRMAPKTPESLKRELKYINRHKELLENTDPQLLFNGYTALIEIEKGRTSVVKGELQAHLLITMIACVAVILCSILMIPCCLVAGLFYSTLLMLVLVYLGFQVMFAGAAAIKGVFRSTYPSRDIFDLVDPERKMTCKDAESIQSQYLLLDDSNNYKVTLCFITKTAIRNFLCIGSIAIPILILLRFI